MNPYPPIQAKDLTPYGIIRRTHGHSGDVVIEVYSAELFKLSPKFLFLELDGLLVPFKVEDMRGTYEQLITSLEFLNSSEASEDYCGKKVFIHSSDFSDEELNEIENSPQTLLGVNTFLPTGQLIGTITNIDESTANLLLQIESPAGEEILLPYVEEWVVDFDFANNKLVIDCPPELATPL